MTTSARLFTRPYRASISVKAASIPTDTALALGILAVVLLALLIGGAIHAAHIDAAALAGLGRG